MLLIAVDTLRADHLGYHGYKRDTSPFLDGFARESHTFLDASVQLPKTFPSIVSMMISQYPNVSGASDNYYNLADEAVTLAEVLQGHGLSTAAYTANGNLVTERRVAQGFGEFRFGNDDAQALTDLAITRLQKDFDKPFFLWLHYIDPMDP